MGRPTIVWRGAQVGAGALLLALLGVSCSGGGSDPGGLRTGSAILYPGAVSLVDGLVGDTPYADCGDSGRADGRNVEVEGIPIIVTWRPPLTRVDAGPEPQLAGYRIYFGHKPGNYSYVIELGEPAAESYRFAGLPRGTYYFAVSAVDSEDREGPLSSVAAISIN